MDATTPTNASSKLPPLTHSLTPLTHLFSASLSHPPVGSPSWAWKQTGQGAYRQAVRQTEGEEEGGGASVVLAQGSAVHDVLVQDGRDLDQGLS